MYFSCKSKAGDENDGADEEYESEEEEVERALRMEGGIPGTSNEFVERVSSRAYDIRRSLQQTVESSSYDGITNEFIILVVDIAAKLPIDN